MRLKDENKKLAIYQSAMTLVTEQGLAGTSMSKIAKLAKVSPSTIYTYFDSKEDMLNKLYIMANQRSLAMFQQNTDSDILTYELYHQWIQAYFEFMVANPIHFSFKEQFLNSPQISDELRVEQFSHYQSFFELIQSAMAKGTIRTMPMPVIVALFFAPFQHLIWSHLRNEMVVTDDVISELTRDVWSVVQA